jgi:hypothetical protein
VLTVARWVLFLASVGALGVAAERLARRATAAGDLRILATGALTAVLAVAEALLLGLIGLGGNGAALTAAALGTAIVVLGCVAADGPSSTSLARAAWRSVHGWHHALVGAVVGLTVAETAYLLWRPAIGTDGLIYHLAQPAIWVTDGHPGSMHPTESGLPIQAYPKTGEVLFSWAIGTARTPLATTLIMVAGFGLTALAGWAVLRRLGVDRFVSIGLTTAVVLTPIAFAQLSGPDTDLLTLTWLLVTAACCLGAIAESSLLPVALISAGLCIGTKTTAGPVLVVLLGVTAWRARDQLARQWIGLTLAAVAAFGTGLVWYVENLVTYHAPLFPFSRFPDGPALPPIVATLGARFASDPGGAIKAATVHHYVRGLGGGLALAAGVVIVAVLLPTVRDRSERTWIELAIVAGVADALLWSVAPFTGWSGVAGTQGLVVGGIRYLLPGFALFALVVALATRVRGVIGVVARVLTAVAIGADLWADAPLQDGYRPRLLALVGAAIAGAVAAYLLDSVRRRVRPPATTPAAPAGGRTRRFVAAAVGLVAAAGAVATLTAATHGYLQRHVDVAEALHIDEPDTIKWLAAQPGWAHGHAPLAVGPVADAIFAGPTFDHALSTVTQSTTCATVRADAKRGWLLLPAKPLHSILAAVPTFDKTDCLAGTTPEAIIDGRTAVFAPRALLARPPPTIIFGAPRPSPPRVSDPQPQLADLAGRHADTGVGRIMTTTRHHPDRPLTGPREEAELPRR